MHYNIYKIIDHQLDAIKTMNNISHRYENTHSFHVYLYTMIIDCNLQHTYTSIRL